MTETTPHSLLSLCIDRKAGRLGTLLEKQLTELTSRASIYWGPANHTQSPWLSALLALGHMHQMHVILNIFICDTKYIYLCIDGQWVQRQHDLIRRRVFSWFVNPALCLFFEVHLTDSNGIWKVGIFRALEL